VRWRSCCLICRSLLRMRLRIIVRRTMKRPKLFFPLTCVKRNLNRSLLLPRHRPSPGYRWVGSCITSFRACSAFTCVTTYGLAKSPSDLLHRRLRRLRCLHRRSDCYRVERSSSRAGLPPAVDQRLFTAHCNRVVTSEIALFSSGLPVIRQSPRGKHPMWSAEL